MKIRIELADDNGVLYVGQAELHRRNRTKVSVSPAITRKSQSRVTCGEALRRLWQSDQFRHALSLKQIAEALSKSGGYNFRGEALLMALSRTNFLTRRGSKGSYVWIQKYPHGD